MISVALSLCYKPTEMNVIKKFSRVSYQQQNLFTYSVCIINESEQKLRFESNVFVCHTRLMIRPHEIASYCDTMAELYEHTFQ
jgi:hypothetical protein